ncbi:glycosyltransferase family 2 protein [Telmatobacter sp. DSM 110680]|uniref:Glycosyltransferase family 2 protein n=1 Tax=Telmatobacter sp. DSM 110680 TaxID=3036704 RepID=A0AAU7DI50_9BACT
MSVDGGILAGTGIERVVAESTEYPIELSVVIPCLNEGHTIAKRVRQALDVLHGAGVVGEVIVADNGSTDGSAEIAEAEGALVARVAEKGYGSAIMGGIAIARGEYVLMADADESHDLTHIPRFLAELRMGHDLVMGNRFHGGIADGAMPFLHRYLGNPVLTGLGKLFFKSNCGDFHCGMRGFTRESYQRMDVRSTGMEFASEMVVKATLLRMKVSEIPTSQLPDGRDHPPHLRTWRDGWRHLRFLLMYSPRWLFLYPGIALVSLGAVGCAWLLQQPRVIDGLVFDVRSLVYAFSAVLLGFQFVAFAVFVKVFAISEGLLPDDPRLTRAFRYITLEVGLAVGGLLLALGILGTVFTFASWAKVGLGTVNFDRALRSALSSVFSLTLGVQVICSSFFLSILGLRRRSVS